MKKNKNRLFEKNGNWYFDGHEIQKGDRLKMDGITWKVVGWGRSPGRSQALFLWIQHEKRGVTIYAPGLMKTSPNVTSQWRECRLPEKSLSLPSLENLKLGELTLTTP